MNFCSLGFRVAKPFDQKAYMAGYRIKNPTRVRCWSLIRGARQRAREKKLPCDIDTAWLAPILERGLCEATGIAFDLVGQRAPFSPTIDRQVPDLGYIKSNCKVVVGIHNQARHNWGDAPVTVYVKHLATRLA